MCSNQDNFIFLHEAKRSNKYSTGFIDIFYHYSRLKNDTLKYRKRFIITLGIRRKYFYSFMDEEAC